MPHGGSMTLEEYDALPEDDTAHHEIQEGIEVRPAVEIISPGTRNVDTHLTSFEHAESGIPCYWLIDLDPPAPSTGVFGLGAPGEVARRAERPRAS